MQINFFRCRIMCTDETLINNNYFMLCLSLRGHMKSVSDLNLFISTMAVFTKLFVIDLFFFIAIYLEIMYLLSLN